MMSKVNMVGMLSHYFVKFWPFIFYFSVVNAVDKCSTNLGQTFTAWDWEVHGKGDTVYHLNLCKKPSSCSITGSSICNKSTNYGSVVASGKKLYATKFGKHGFLVTFNGTAVKDKKCGKSKYLQTIIKFQCEKSLGYPVLVDETECIVTFEFNTNEACSGKTSVKEIPCVIYNPKENIKRDLSPLIKQTGGHLVASSARGVDIWINVCREITNNGDVPAKSCPKGSASCRVDTKSAIGEITDETKLEYDKEGKNIKLVYYASKVEKECGRKPTTNITFICPTSLQDDLYGFEKNTAGNGPILISSLPACHYEIEWRTDYACPDKVVVTNNCTYSNGDFTVDLFQLAKATKQLSYGVKTKDYDFRIKVCSNGQPCGADVFGAHTAVCQINPKKHNNDKSCGDADHRTIRYADRQVILTYKNGASCSNGINRTTIIEFECDPTIGVGAPTFVKEEYCYYFFKWSTRFVCQSRKAGTCSVTKMIANRRVSFDLSILTKTEGSWLALNSHADTADYVYYINVCGNVHTSYRECDGAAACEVYRGKGKSIGAYRSPLIVSKDNSLQLNYTGGDCKGFGRRITTIIRFVCKAKNLENPPELVSRSWDGCEYVFTWSTAAACSLQIINGDNCMLKDNITGNVFDLTDLKKGPKLNSKPDYFTVKGSSDQTFKIKVCGSLKDCHGQKDSGVCQTASGKDYSAGKGNSKLFYYDGKVNLTYSDGFKCHKHGKHPRSTHITFFCNETAGVGTPRFDKENYCTYHFIWYTSYVCPAKTMECITKDSQGREYDLSSLVRTDKENWVTIVGTSKYYINVCRALVRNKQTQGCPTNSTVCVNGTTSIGSVSGPLKMSKDGLLTLQYSDGKYRTIINFICEQYASAPTLESSGKFTYSFNWKTPAACPVKSSTTSGCSATSSIGETINIDVLTKRNSKVYSLQPEINGEKVKIRLNICKNITCNSDKTTTACITDKKGTRSIGRLAKSTIEYQGDIIVLKYRGGDLISGADWARYAVTVINFICARDVTVGTPVFRDLIENVYTFEFRTSVVCPAKTLQCSFTEPKSKEKYNLSPLGLETGNWIAADTRQHLVYYINVCKAYNPAGLSPACSGPVGGCQVDKKANRAHNMGYIRSDPFQSTTGDLTIRYIGAEESCKKNLHRSTRINFFCSRIHESPVYITETDECEYIFNWKTPGACALSTHKGSECQVYDPQYGVLYMLHGLRDKTRDLTLNDGSTLSIGFCDETVKVCGGIACLKTGKEPEVFKDKDVSLSYYDDTIIATYNGSKHKIVNKFNCGTELLSKGEVLSSDDKTIEIQWTTSLACPPVKGEECSLANNGEFYDLSVLARDTNWQARLPFKDSALNKNTFYISVCKPLERINGAGEVGWRAAMVSSTGELVSLGAMDQRLRILNGYLVMSYNRGDNYTIGQNISTHIQFVCDTVPEGQGGIPVLDFYNGESHSSHFTWVTKAACSVSSQVTEPSQKNCTAIHPMTMKTIDLNKLYKPVGYVLQDQNKHSYKLNLCGDFQLKGCPTGTGMCQTSNGKSISVGAVDNTLHYRQGFLYLLYKNGDKCDNGGRKMETMISFFCNRSVPISNEPTVEKTSDCTHYVTWQTPLACEAEVECITQGTAGTFYDLSPLIKNNGNYEVFHKDKKYLINVCRSLVNESSCTSNAAVCAIDLTEKKRTITRDFGHVNNSPIFGSEKNGPKVKLIYVDGKTCGKKNQTTTIEFFCEENKGYYLGHPSPPVSDDKCSLRIHWNTSLVCDPKPVNSTTCQVHDPKTKLCLNLAELQGLKTLKIPVGDVYFNICGGIQQGPAVCKNSEMCLVTDKKVAVNKTGISFNGREAQLSYGNVVIILYCGEDKLGKPQYIGKKTKGDQYVFNWITPVVCPPRRLSCEVTDGENVYDLGVLRKHNAISFVDKSDRSTYFINICGNIPFEQSTICSSRVTALRNTSKGVLTIIGKDTVQQLSIKTGDPYPIHLVYKSDGIKGCPNSASTITHKFKCANVNLPPHLESADSRKCSYVFTWQTYAACAEKRKEIKEISSWTFQDNSRGFCDLELTKLKEQILASAETKNCSFGKPVLYSEGEYYELDVDCSRKNKPVLKIDVNLICNVTALHGNLVAVDKKSKSELSLVFQTDIVCATVRYRSCTTTKILNAAKTAVAVIGTFLAIGILAAVIFFACNQEKRESATLWLRWHVRKYICCKPSYQASYRYRKVNTADDDGETDFIIETHSETVFSDDDDDDDDDNNDNNDDGRYNDDDELLPWDDDLLNLDE